MCRKRGYYSDSSLHLCSNVQVTVSRATDKNSQHDSCRPRLCNAWLLSDCEKTMDKSFMRKLFPIILSNLVCWFYALGTVPLAFMYQAFPGQDALVILIVTGPGLVCMFASMAAAPLMRVLNKKTLVIIGLLCSFLGGLLIRFFGEGNLMLCIIAAALTGIPAGLISAVNYAALAEISPEDMRDKVCGWGDASCAIGMALASFLAGFLCADGVWTRAFDVYFISAAILIVVVAMYPSLPPIAQDVEAAQADTNAGAGVLSALPLFIIGIIVMKFLGGVFYVSSTIQVSEYLITEAQIGDAIAAGNAVTVYSVVSTIVAIFVFAWLKAFKGLSLTLSFALCGAALILVPRIPSVLAVIVLLGLTGGFVQAMHSTASTLATMGTPARGVELATSLFVTGSFLGEFVGGYVPPMLSDFVLGNHLPSTVYLVSGACLIILAVVAIPFCTKAYAAAFGNESASPETE